MSPGNISSVNNYVRDLEGTVTTLVFPEEDSFKLVISLQNSFFFNNVPLVLSLFLLQISLVCINTDLIHVFHSSHPADLFNDLIIITEQKTKEIFRPMSLSTVRIASQGKFVCIEPFKCGEDLYIYVM